MRYTNISNKRKRFTPVKTKGKKYLVNYKIAPSEAEKIIIKTLKKLKISFEREVSFFDFRNENGNLYRFDFFFPDRNIIIEYDGAEFHLEGNLVDISKNEYCNKNNIKLIRLNKKHYYVMEEVLKDLLK